MPLPPLVDPVAALDAAEVERTARHAVLPGFGELAQRRLAAATVAVVGAGGIGSPVVLALAAAGIGTLRVIDDDVVEASNLQRQVMHRLGDVGAPKTASAVRAAADLSPATRVEEVRERLTRANAATLLAGADVVVDGTDAFDSREAVAAGCEALGVPLVWGVIQGYDAQATVFWSAPPEPAEPVVLADLHPAGATAPSCAEAGVLGALCLQLGGILAAQVVSLVTGVGEPLLGRLLVIEGLRGRHREVALRPSRATAPVPLPFPGATVPPRLDVAAAARAAAGGAVLLDVREPEEHATGMAPGAVAAPLAGVLADPAALGAGPFVVVCEGGVRATRAAEALIAAGAEASVLDGGMRAWRAAGAEGVA